MLSENSRKLKLSRSFHIVYNMKYNKQQGKNKYMEKKI
jgi:hypothetical protein